ncbi:MAG: hypothetical protein PWP01_1156 [Methanosarcinales archaeon]|nr:hypothetical protein [Methanosarcinales archaeon]
MKTFMYICACLFVVLLFCGCVGDLPIKDLSSLENMTAIGNFTADARPKLPPKEIALEIGESTEVDGIDVAVKNVWFTKNLQDFKTFGPIDRYSGIAPQNCEFIVAEVLIKNNGNKTLYPTVHDFIVIDGEGNIYPYNILTHSFEDAMEFKELQKGESAGGKIAFLIPENETDIKIAYCFGSIADFRAMFDIFKTKWAIWHIRR